MRRLAVVLGAKERCGHVQALVQQFEVVHIAFLDSQQYIQNGIAVLGIATPGDVSEIIFPSFFHLDEKVEVVTAIRNRCVVNDQGVAEAFGVIVIEYPFLVGLVLCFIEFGTGKAADTEERIYIISCFQRCQEIHTAHIFFEAGAAVAGIAYVGIRFLGVVEQVTIEIAIAVLVLLVLLVVYRNPVTMMLPLAGIGMSLVIDDTKQRPGNGTFSWNGIAGTEWWYDPKNDVFMVFMIQDRALLSEYQKKNRAWIYDALKK